MKKAIRDLNLILVGLVIFILAIVVMCVGGCAMIEPKTTVAVNPITGSVKVTNTKDTDLEAKGVKAVSGEKSFEMESLTLSDKSSPVIKENVQQMLAFVEQQKAANEGIAIALSGINESLKTLVPFLNLTPNTMAAVLNQLKQVDMQIDITNKTLKMGDATTQPAQ